MQLLVNIATFICVEFTNILLKDTDQCCTIYLNLSGQACKKASGLADFSKPTLISTQSLNPQVVTVKTACCWQPVVLVVIKVWIRVCVQLYLAIAF